MQSKTTMRFYVTSVKMIIIKMTKNNKHWCGCGERRVLVHCWQEWMKLVQPLWKMARSFLKKLKLEIPLWSSNPTSRYFQRKQSHCIKQISCTPKFTAALFTIAKTWKQLKCPLRNKWMKKIWYVICNIFHLYKRKKSCYLGHYGWIFRALH